MQQSRTVYPVGQSEGAAATSQTDPDTGGGEYTTAYVNSYHTDVMSDLLEKKYISHSSKEYMNGQIVF